MREPLWWMWLAIFSRLFVRGDDYLLQPRWELRRSAQIASDVRTACKRLRDPKVKW